MGTGPDHKRRVQRSAWPGLRGRNPLTLPTGRFEALCPVAIDYVMTAGVSEGRPSLAACWLAGIHEVAELPDNVEAPWAEGPSPPALAFVGAFGAAPPDDLDRDALEALADRWFVQLDAAGANDRVRAFADGWDRLVRHDNPHGHPLHLAFAISLADAPLALEPLPVRLLPQRLLDEDLDDSAVYLPGGSRRIPGGRGAQLELGNEAVQALRPVFEELDERTTGLDLGLDATLGDVLEASGLDVDRMTTQMAEMVEPLDPAAAYAVVATDGLLVTEMNADLVSPQDRRRWSQAASAYSTIFERLEEICELDRDDSDDEDRWYDAAIDAGAILLDELVAVVDDGEMDAYDWITSRVAAHPAGQETFDNACTYAFTELSVELSADSFSGRLADDVRRLAAVRFADRDPTFPAAVDRALEVADTIVHGDRPLHEAVGDDQQTLAAWVVLTAVWRAATTDGTLRRFDG